MRGNNSSPAGRQESIHRWGCPVRYCCGALYVALVQEYTKGFPWGKLAQKSAIRNRFL